MLNENIQSIRKSKGLSQEELAIKLNVVRQTVSKWERGLSVPDSEMLINISEILETPVSVLLGEPNTETGVPVDDLKVISEKLEVINLQLAKREAARIRTIRCMLVFVCVLIAVVFIALFAINGSYMEWDHSDPEQAIAGTFLHGFEFLFVRLAPIALVASLIGIAMTFRKG